MYSNNRNGNGAASARRFMALWAMLLAYCVLGAAATFPSTPVRAQSFSGLGFLPGGTFSYAQAVSADGTVVVGSGNATGTDIFGEAFRWTQGGGMAGLGFLTGGYDSYAQAVNADGTVVVGNSSAPGREAFRWIEAGGMAGLGFLPGGTSSEALGVNANGTVVVGRSSATGIPFGEAFRWTQAGGMADLGFLTGGSYSFTEGVNADGTVVVGYGERTGPFDEAFRWTQAGGMAGLGFLPGGTYSFAGAVNADGTVVVGVSTSTGSPIFGEAFRWTQAGGMAGLGFLPGGTFSEAHAVNADGTVVVGKGNATGTGSDPKAFRWTQAGGMQSVQALLKAKGVSTTGWTLSDALGVSTDGQVIVGTGRDPSGRKQGWIARLASAPGAFSATLDIHFGRAPNQDTFNLQSNVTLSSTASNGIKPLTEGVKLQIGTFTTTIAPGSFSRRQLDQSFTFVGVIRGVSLNVLIKPAGFLTLRYAFNAAATGASLTGTANPVPVTLTIGDDSVMTSVIRARISHTEPKPSP